MNKRLIQGIKGFFKNIIKFRKDLWNFRPYDYSHNLSILKTSIDLTKDYIKEHGLEEDKSRLCKVKRMERASKIIANILGENGFDYMTMAEEDLGYEYKETGFSLDNVDNHDCNNNHKLSLRTRQLMDEEWEELWDVMNKDCRGWWD